METIDLNLIGALDVLLAEGSVTGAAQRLGLSASAMSRTLSRLRSATGDPLLVRAGRGLVPTPRAIELRDHVHATAQDARAILSPLTSDLDISALDRTFAIRAGEGFVELYSAALVAVVTAAAPHVCLRFSAKPDKNARPLREAHIDLEIGVIGTSAPEIRTQVLFRDKFIGAVRVGHPLLTGRITPERYASSRHVVASRKETFTGPVDDALHALGLRREIVAVVPGHPDAMRIALQSDLIALVPRGCLRSAGPSADPHVAGLIGFDLPFDTPEIMVSAMWHPRLDADPAHRWLRSIVMSVCHSAVFQSEARP